MSETTLQEAILQFQKECPTLEKNSQGYGYKYASLPSVVEKILPILIKHGITVTQSVCRIDECLMMLTTLSKGNERVESAVPIVYGDKKGMQEIGAAISYGRRYGLCCALCIVTDEDTDAANPNDAWKIALINDVKARLAMFPEYEKEVSKTVGDLNKLTHEQYIRLSNRLALMEDKLKEKKA